MESQQFAAQAVDRGSKILDIYYPGWESKIDLERLDLISGTDCVLGQLFGDFVRGMNVINQHGQAVNLGFCPDLISASSHPDLRDEWIKEITARRS